MHLTHAIPTQLRAYADARAVAWVTLRVYPTVAPRGLTLKGHGSGRILKDLPGRDTRAVRLSDGHRDGRREAFQRLVCVNWAAGVSTVGAKKDAAVSAKKDTALKIGVGSRLPTPIFSAVSFIFSAVSKNGAHQRERAIQRRGQLSSALDRPP